MSCRFYLFPAGEAACRSLPLASTPATVAGIYQYYWVGHANIQNTLIYAQLRDRTRDGQARRWLGSERLV
ncbi:MAG TPA: hypothetical protein ENI60_02870 [Candidatus Fraserbacteria bacterium]|nr:hypothetical protein [Candidatus Fraserbacteria bacterium]